MQIENRVLTFDKETKRTIRYTAQSNEGVALEALDCGVSILYVQKNALPQPWPKKIEIIVASEGDL